ncbi:MAG: hypothetical protein H6797_02225 [Candidatus Nomurabacteria bacterium]|nr:MAG: hypothetical protein H6797_02225 [Candidatus Nomurabacteria bacterium]
MYVPTNMTLVGSLAPITTVDFSLHTFLGVSWLVLLPYTVFGVVLMVHSQSKLIRGERELKRQNDSIDALSITRK